MAQTESGPGAEQMRQVPVEWEALEDAFENNAPEVHSYLHLATGEVLRVVDGIADPEMHTRIASDPNYLRVEPVSSREQYRWMERFIPMIDDADLRDRLLSAIDGKGAFRRFKDALMSHGPERERWFAFRSERLRVFMEAWLMAHAIQPVKREALPQQAAPRQATPALVEQGLPRRQRTAEFLRKQLGELDDSLGARDLEKVTAFAEFIKARRAARSFTLRHDSAEMSEAGDEQAREAATPESEEQAASDEDTPPSERRTAAR